MCATLWTRNIPREPHCPPISLRIGPASTTQFVPEGNWPKSITSLGHHIKHSPHSTALKDGLSIPFHSQSSFDPKFNYIKIQIRATKIVKLPLHNPFSHSGLLKPSEKWLLGRQPALSGHSRDTRRALAFHLGHSRVTCVSPQLHLSFTRSFLIHTSFTFGSLDQQSV